MLHYHFAHQEEDKRIEDALEVHGTDWSDYDAVFANPGNQPRMEVGMYVCMCVVCMFVCMNIVVRPHCSC